MPLPVVQLWVLAGIRSFAHLADAEAPSRAFRDQGPNAAVRFNRLRPQGGEPRGLRTAREDRTGGKSRFRPGWGFTPESLRAADVIRLDFGAGF